MSAEGFVEGMSAMAHVAMLEAGKLSAEGDLFGAAINARLAAACLAYEDWRVMREKDAASAAEAKQ